MEAGPSGRFFRPWWALVSESLPLGATIALFSAFASAIMIVALLLLPETRGRSLASLDIGSGGAPSAAAAEG